MDKKKHTVHGIYISRGQWVKHFCRLVIIFYFLHYASHPCDYSSFVLSNRSRISSILLNKMSENFLESVVGQDLLDDTWKKILYSVGNMYETPYPSSDTGPNPPPGEH